MKHEAIGHPKMHDLAEAIDAPIYAAYGIMEAIWHHAGDYAPDGDIGKLTDAAIARAVGWQGKSHILIDALVKTKWLDREEQHRLVIHDWDHHAQDWIKKKLKRIQGKGAKEHPDWLQVYEKLRNLTSQRPVSDQSVTSQYPVTSSLTGENGVNNTDQSVTSHRLASTPVTDQPRAGGLREVKGGIGVASSSSGTQTLTTSSTAIGNGHSAKERTEVIRVWIEQFVNEFGLTWGPPDTAICGRIEKALNGAPLEEFEVLLQKIFQRGQKPSKNYAWFVTLTADEFGEYHAS